MAETSTPARPARSEVERERADTAWMLFALGLVLAPHVMHLPLWASAVTALLLAWRVALTWQRLRPVAKPLLGLIAGLCLLGVLLEYRTLFGRDAGVALLALLLGVKLMEMRTRRDVFVVIFLAFFVVLTNFFYSQGIGVALLMVAAVWALFVALISVQHAGEDVPLAEKGRLAGVMMAQAVPITLILFFFFPRTDGPLWGMPADARGATTGLSDSMAPGSIASLSESEAVAFRARFDGAVPPPAERYWRGPVLGQYDGQAWSALPAPVQPSVRITLDQRRSYAYEVTLEPHQRRWLFALEAPGMLPALGEERATLNAQMELLAPHAVRERVRYAMRSYPVYRAEPAGPEAAAASLWTQLPAGAAPRLRRYAATLRAQLGPEAGAPALAQAVLERFHREPYRYTLEPPATRGDPLDGFFFDTRAGFCEHYSASFVALMRMLGVPARVVTGYQGGELNPVDGYLVVRQADAHAWAEILVPGRGWVRVDPTAAVSPERVERGARAPAPAALPLPGGLGATVKAPEWLKGIRYRWDAAQNAWNQWVLSYNATRQRALLDSLGLEGLSWERVSLAVFALVATLLIGMAAFTSWTHQRVDPERRLYLRACERLARRGLAREAHEGPLAFETRAGAALPPDTARLFARITELFIALVYRPAEHRLKLLAELNRCVRRFRP